MDSVSPQSKLCKRCSLVRSIELFSKDKRYRDGYQPWCKLCYADYRKMPEQKAKQQKRYQERYADPEYRADYRVKQNEHTRQRWHSDPNYRKRKNAQNLISKRRPHRIEGTRELGRITSQKRRAKVRSNTIRYLTQLEWYRIRDHYGPLCLCCGRARRLTIDHVLPIAAGGVHEAPNIQPLCLPCNQQKNTKRIDYRPDQGAWIQTWW